MQRAISAALDASPPGRIGVACSGGADSMALADAVLTVGGARELIVLTIDHGLHASATQVADAVAAFWRARGARAVVHPVKVAKRASIEAAAREARYAGLEQLAAEHGLTTILMGHTARDQAETVLMRLLRGTGPAGLAGIPRRRGPFLRPMLELAREMIDSYVAQRGLPTWADPMNEDRAITRVRVRHEILPCLRAENGRLDAALARLAASAREWLEVIDDAAMPLARFPMRCEELAARPAAIRKRAVVLALDALGLTWDAVHLDAIDRLVMSPPRGEKVLELPGARVVRTYDQLACEILCGVASDHGSDLATPSHDRATCLAYAVRPWQHGDRMRPHRLKGRSRKLADLYGDAKIPRRLRASARIIVRISDQEIVWAEHVGLAHPSVLDPSEHALVTRLGSRS